jgi:SAM-dependent methyltransferase
MKLRFQCMREVPDLQDRDLDGLTRLIRNPFTGIVYKRRFRMVLGLCQDGPLDDVLEIGYGAGFLSYCLAPACKRYIGVDLYGQPAKVQENLARQGVAGLDLRVGDARRLDGIESGSLDLVVSISCLEHIREVEDVQRQVLRVLKPGGRAVYGMPVKNIISRLLFKAVGYDDNVIHPTTPRQVLAAAQSVGLSLEQERFFPPIGGHACSLYWAGRFRKR